MISVVGLHGGPGTATRSIVGTRVPYYIGDLGRDRNLDNYPHGLLGNA